MRSVTRFLVPILSAALLTSCGGGTERSALPSAHSTSTKRAPQASTVVAGVTVGGLTKVAERRISRTVYEYTFKVSVTSAVPKGLMVVTAQLASAGAGVTIVDGNVTVGYLPAGATVPADDTITIQQDRTYDFQPAALSWSVSGLDDLDRSMPVAGPDTNNNGVRDDIDGIITRTALSVQQKQALTQVAKAYQQMLVGPDTAAAASAIDRAQACLSRRTPEYVNLARGLFAVTVNTEPRFNAFLAFERAVGAVDVPAVTGDPCNA